MPTNASHHKSRKRRYSIILVPEGDAGESKNYRIALWHVAVSMVLGVALVIGVFVMLMIHTPLGTYIRLPNPDLDNKYGRHLVSLNQRIEALMREMVELRGYNVKLRNALGENVV
ncbi:MAG: hypothetical protein WD295_02965, partial [Bacteroidota bacterium]